MTCIRHIPRALGRAVRAYLRDTSGGVLVEFALVVSLFLFLFAALLDFGRLSYSGVTAQSAAQIAARLAIVRPAACPGVPDRHQRGTNTALRYGTSCSAASGVCASVATVTCTGAATNATASEIWDRINPLLPVNATIDMMQFSYSFDPKLGFLGGPYTPMVTVELNLNDFQFASPLAALANAAGATNSALPSSAAYSSFSVSLPAEDLAQGESG
ncbi:pilus assembly protein [Roseovarius sp. PS-C2]|uniref:TadE/TadG family type IV pilus assembly protein n=1 Tax=Roseovarius sp. PS-C2 TaxID=2820814 RepID=UPI001C0E8678|nr:TadE/TadG family type IV pilus assembly protein [Roseovarius sp. PS-C2]MBU3261954.1 pilus assembly protein [Roseovarius sp. PS-C2]